MGANRVQEVDIGDEIFSYGGLRDLMGTISLDILIIKGLDDSSLRLSQAENQVPFKQKELSVSASKLLNVGYSALKFTTFCCSNS